MRLASIAIALCLFACAKPGASSADDAKAAVDQNALYLFYAHGKIVEDQGPNAVSDVYGPYQYEDILAAFRSAGFVVNAELRPKGADAALYARRLSDDVKRVLSAGVPPSHVMIVGASKGSFIAALAAHEISEPVNLVLLASCSASIVATLLENDITLPGRVLAIRDRRDTELSGSCARVFDASPDILEHEEIVTTLDVAHGLVFRPYPEWVEPTIAWAKGAD